MSMLSSPLLRFVTAIEHLPLLVTIYPFVSLDFGYSPSASSSHHTSFGRAQRAASDNTQDSGSFDIQALT